MPRALLAIIVIGLLLPAVAGSGKPGIVGRPAPAWGVSEWINLPAGEQSLDVDDLDGRVVFMLGFQSWCPGCHSRGFPTLKQLIDHYKTADDVFDMMKGFVHEAGIAALVATHNLALAARMDRVIRLEDGLLLDGAG